MFLLTAGFKEKYRLSEDDRKHCEAFDFLIVKVSQTTLWYFGSYADIGQGQASQCGYVVGTSASHRGDPGSNPIAARKSCEVYPGLGILQPQWNPYPTLTPPSC